MKWITMLLILFALISCKPDKSPQTNFYKATEKENVALLTLTVVENSFYGHYEIRYGSSGKDFGEIRGTKVGDTLRGKFKYLSYGGNQKLEPFVLLKHGDILKLGSGVTATYMNIPYYVPKTLEFKDSSFQFHPINIKSAKDLNSITE
jgi:hypothetical protein